MDRVNLEHADRPAPKRGTVRIDGFPQAARCGGRDPLIELHGVTKRYAGGQIGLREVSLAIERGQLVFLTGASGAGKTTFLKLIYREEAASEGYVLVNGRNVSSLPAKKIPYLRRTIGVVFQSFRLIPRKTVYENVCYLPRILGFDAKQQKQQAYETLRRVGLAHRMNAFPMQLSGGEQQRVAIARALINQPDILLADEPTGNLDPQLSEDILRLFLEINLQGTTVVFATHDQSLIERVGHRVLTLSDGRLVDDRLLEGRLLPRSAGAAVDIEAAVLGADPWSTGGAATSTPGTERPGAGELPGAEPPGSEPPGAEPAGAEPPRPPAGDLPDATP